MVAGIPVRSGWWPYLRQDAVTFGIGWIPRPGVTDVLITLWNMLVGYNGALPWYLIPGLLAGAVGLLLGMRYAVARRKVDRRDFFWFWLLVAPLTLVFAVSQFRPLYVDRYFMALLPAVLMLTVRGWFHLPRRSWALGLGALVLASSLISTVSIFRDGSSQKEDWRSAARYVEQRMQPGDGLLTETPVEWLAARHYLTSTSGVTFAWVLDAPDPANPFDTPVQRVWVFSRNPREDGHRQGVLADFDPFAPSVSPMPDWLQPRRDRVLMQKEFNGVTVLLVEVPPGDGLSSP